MQETRLGRDSQIVHHAAEAAHNAERPLTSKEAAGFLGVHPKTMKRLAARREVPGHFRFGRWFFYESELDSWMRTELNSERHP